MSRLVRLALVTAALIPAAIIASPWYVASAAPLPDVSQISTPLPSDTIIYASDSITQLADLHPPGYQHYDESLSSMGLYLPDSIVAIEDRNFYHEPGVDPAGIVRATIVDFQAGRTVEGAATITQ